MSVKEEKEYCFFLVWDEIQKGAKWRIIPEYPEYKISSFGSVIRTDHYSSGNQHHLGAKVLSHYTNSNGYICVDIKQKHFSLHRLLAEAFMPNPDKKPTVNHINGVKTDNRLENLEWATYSENNQHAYDLGLKKYSYGV